MSWLDFFQKKRECSIKFGRGIYADIAKDEEELFNKSSEAFEKNKVLDAYEYFLTSLINYNDKNSNENIFINKEDEKLQFTLFQGSAKIIGTITKESFYAEVTIVKKELASVALKRRVLERNYEFTYVNFISDAEFIKLKLYQDNITLSPQKIFFPLRELALNADYDKEFIVSEFATIPLEEVEHLEAIDEEELKIKYDSLKEWIEELNNKVLTLPTNDNAGMQAFLYLNILFKIDYLLVPKYKIYQKLSRKLQAYFGDENATIEAKNEELKKYIITLNELEFGEFAKNFYNAKYTFSTIEKSSYEEFCNFITESLIKVKWYKNSRYTIIIPTIYSYMALYSLYNYGLNAVVKELVHLLVSVQNAKYFRTLSCSTFYDETKESFSKRHIIQSIDSIILKRQDKYKTLSTFSHELNFNSMNEFSYSYFQAIKNLVFEEV